MDVDLHHPASVADAVALAARLGESARFVAGGTDLVIQMARGRAAPAHLIDITRLPGLDGIVDGGDAIVIGALTTHKSIERHPPFQQGLIALVEAARVIGGHQVRNIATVGGNIVNASPAADLVPALLVLDAEAILVSEAGERTVALDGFLIGPGRIDRRTGELLRAVRFARPAPFSATAFLKAGRRKAMEISVVCAAASLTLDPASGRCVRARIAAGAVGPRSLRFERAEQLLEGQVPTPALLQAAAGAAAESCRPIDDVRASAAFRRSLVQTLVGRALAACLDRIPGAHP